MRGAGWTPSIDSSSDPLSAVAGRRQWSCISCGAVQVLSLPKLDWGTMPKVAAAVIIEAGRLFLARRAPGGHLAGAWELPGGKVEPGETAQECLARELLEEFGMAVDVGRPVDSSHYVYAHGAVELLALPARRLSRSYELRVHDDCGWFTPSEAYRLDMAPADMPLIGRLPRGDLDEFRPPGD